MSNLVPLSDITTMAEVAAKSRMFGFKNPEEAMAIMLLCQAESLHPAVAMRDYHVIQGRPALKADAMLARFQQAGGSVQWKVYTDREVTGTFSHPQGGSLDVTWTLEQAKKIGITTKDNWAKYPRAMLRARCLSEGIRAVYPGVVVGVYTPEEVQDFEPPKMKDMGKAEVVDSEGVITVSVDDPAPGYPFFVPGMDEPYANYHNTDEWIKAYAGMVAKIQNSPKFSDEEKVTKLENLGKCNEELMKTFSGILKGKLKAAVVEAGGQVGPKSQESLQSTETAPSAEQF
jgi:hypothetical protein